MKRFVKKCIAAPFYAVLFIAGWVLFPILQLVGFCVDFLDKFTEESHVVG